jgi:hypothetical protein
MSPIQAVEAGAQGALEAVRALLGAQPAVAAQDDPPTDLRHPSPAPGGPAAGPGPGPGATPLTEPPQASVPADGRATMAQLAAGHTPHVASTRAAATAATAAPADAPQRSTGLPPEDATLRSLARPTDSVALPVMITPLQTLAAHLQRPAHLPTQRRPPAAPPGPREPSCGASGADDASDLADAWADHAAGTDSAVTSADEEPAEHADLHASEPDPDYDRLQRWLADAAQHAALRELAQQRRVLLIVATPDRLQRGGRAARVHLLVPRPQQRGESQVFNARWWPGAGRRADWTAWRLHRDADAAGGLRLRSRHLWPMAAGAVTLLLRLGPTPPSLLDAGSACLDVPDVQRFGHHLGGQWSLLALCCPAVPHADSPSA